VKTEKATDISSIDLLVLSAILHFTAFRLAGIFASLITSGSGEVLSSPFGGTFNTTYDSAVFTQTLDSERDSKLQCDTQFSQEHGAACSPPSFIFVAGIFIVGLSYFTEDLVAFIPRERKRGAVEEEMWMNTELLQPQHKLYGRLEHGTRHEEPGKGPLTNPSEMLVMPHLREGRATVVAESKSSPEGTERSPGQSQTEGPLFAICRSHGPTRDRCQ
jgi:hypothetical protein